MDLDQLIFSSMKDGFVAFDRDYRIMRWNPSMEQVTGINAEDIIGKVAFDVFPFIKEIGEDKYTDMALAGESVITEKRRYTIPGTEKTGYFEAHYSPLKNLNKENIGAVGIFRSVTKRVLAELEAAEFIGEQKASERFKALVDSVPTMIWASDANGVNKFVNRFGMEYVGLEPGRTQLEHWLPAIHPEDLGYLLGAWEKAFSEGQPVETQHRMQRASDNSFRWVLFRAFPVRDSNNKVMEWHGTITDIHDQVLASKRSLQLQDITAELSGAITPSQVADIIVDKGRTAVGAKNGVLAVLTKTQEIEIVSIRGYTPKADDGSQRIPMSTRIPLTEAIRQRKIIYVENIEMAQKQYPDIVSTMKQANESAFIAIPLIVENKVIGVLGLSFNRKLNVTPEKESFLLTLAGLCSQAYERSRIYELELSARALAESANAAKTNLLAAVSHEIRTPLASIIAYSELLMSDDLASDRKNSFVEALNRNGQILVRLIDDILDLSKIESGRLSFEKVDFELCSFLAEIVEHLRQEADRKHIKFEFKKIRTIPGRVTTDPFRLRQILLNICNNAIKFTEKGSVRVEVDYQSKSESSPDQLIFSVIDTGVGLKPDAHERLFKPFSQGLSAGTYKHRGTGLGLVISRNLARMLGGDVELVSSIPGQGTTFQIRIACMVNAQEIREERKTEDNRKKGLLRGKDVLIAEDAPDLQDLLTTMLIKDGANVDVADNGHIALNLSREKKYDLVIMDLQMPKLDGYQTASQLRSEGFDNPIIAITANALADQSKSFEHGFDAHLIKPVNSDRLLQTISDYVSL
jgi:PAS domain S-box-containing protein